MVQTGRVVEEKLNMDNQHSAYSSLNVLDIDTSVPVYDIPEHHNQ